MWEIYGNSPLYPIKSTQQNGNRIYVKREDLLPFSLGGNKVRIACEFFRDMETKGCDTMVVYGNTRSNLCRVIANQCCIQNIPCYMISSREEHEKEAKETGNSKIMELLGAKIIPCSKSEIASTVEETLKAIERAGRKPYYIYGNKWGTGNEATATAAYAKAYGEIQAFEEKNGFSFDYIFHASGTGATQSGLICGHILAGDHTKIIGISVSSREYERGVSVIRTGAESYLKGIHDSRIFEPDREIFLECRYNKGGYGLYDQEVLDCIRQQFRENSLPLDPVYTGKAFLGMEKYLEEHKITDKNILFLHTGGTPLFYDCLNAGKLKQEGI
ncbi:MAG: 1-aminocyclopropane-1-carboxylate deaminase/D-cysteine desulfhydrase [Blautia sp.]